MNLDEKLNLLAILLVFLPALPLFLIAHFADNLDGCPWCGYWGRVKELME